MTIEDLGTPSTLNVPHTNGSIGGARYQRVSVIFKGPDSALVALQRGFQRTSLGVVNVDISVITSSQNLVRVKLQTSNNVTVVSTESEVLRLDFRLHPSPTDSMMPAIQGLVKIETTEGGHADIRIRDSSSGSVGGGIWSLRCRNIPLPIRFRVISATGRDLALS
jgi:hypothetical protein